MRDAIRFLGEHAPMPVHCIPNAGIPHQGPNGETIFPEEPEPAGRRRSASSSSATASAIVGGCCGTTPEHIRAIAERCASRSPATRARAPRAATCPR